MNRVLTLAFMLSTTAALFALHSGAAPTTGESSSDLEDSADQTVVCECELTGDGIVSGPDSLILFADFGCVAGVGNCIGDCTGDGVTGMPDYIVLQNEWQTIDCE